MFDGDGRVFQNCFVVEDLDKAMDQWINNVGVGPFFVQRSLGSLEIDYRGTPSSLDIDLALAQAGPVCIELIQVHGTNPSVYLDSYPKGSGGGFHHVGMLAKDYDATVKAYEDAGYARAMEGVFGTTRFAYMDTRSSLGFMIEFHHETEEFLSLYSGLAEASDGWNGERPIRELTEVLTWLETADQQ